VTWKAFQVVTLPLKEVIPMNVLSPSIKMQRHCLKFHIWNPCLSWQPSPQHKVATIPTKEIVPGIESTQASTVNFDDLIGPFWQIAIVEHINCQTAEVQVTWRVRIWVIPRHGRFAWNWGISIVLHVTC
jgi:hypothetical protein